MIKKQFMTMTLKELEERTEASNVQWAYYFTGKRSPSLKSLEKYSKSLGIPLGRLTEWIRERRDITMERRKTG